MFLKNYPKTLVLLILPVLSGALTTACAAENQTDQTGKAQENRQQGVPGEGTGAGIRDDGEDGQDGEPLANVAGSGAGFSGQDEICADVDVRVSRINPWVMFVIDGSRSMDDPFPGAASRWEAMRTALMDPVDGVVARLQSVVYFGMVLFSGNSGSTIVFPWDPAPPPAEPCPLLITVDPQLNNFDGLDQLFPDQPLGGWTPTALALEQAYQLMPDPDLVIEKDLGPQYVVLCTDGEPNGCADPITTLIGGPPVDFEGPVQAVTEGVNKGIKTFVVSLASDGVDYKQHLEQLAQIGETGSPAFSPVTKDDLVQRLSEIVGGAVGCKVKLNGTVAQGEECSGEVQLNGQQLQCNGPDGWKLADQNHIELLGKACEGFVHNPTAILHAGFPCGVFTIE